MRGRELCPGTGRIERSPSGYLYCESAGVTTSSQCLKRSVAQPDKQEPCRVSSSTTRPLHTLECIIYIQDGAAPEVVMMLLMTAGS